MREEEKKRLLKKINLKRVFKKRWVLPAVYITTAALLITAVIWYNVGGSNLAELNKNEGGVTDTESRNIGNKNEPVVEVNKPIENFALPVTDPDAVVIKQQFYDSSADSKDQEEALVFYNNQYHPNTGLNIGTEDNSEFDVAASLSGSVSKVEDDALLGNMIEITHNDGIVTRYQSVQNIKVAVGDNVKQGQIIATANKSQFNKDAGIHVHFEIRKDSTAVDPLHYFNKPLTALTETKPAAEEKVEDDASKSEDREQSENDANE